MSASTPWRYAGIVCVVAAAWAAVAVPTTYGDAPVFTDPHIPSGERTVYRMTARDGTVTTSEHRVDAKSTAGGEVYVITTTSKVMVLSRSDMTPVSIDRADPDGRILWQIQYQPDRAIFIHPGPTRNKVEKVDRNRYDVNAITHVVRGFPLGRTDRVSFNLVVPDGAVGVYVAHVREESVTVPAGTFDCARLVAGVSGIKGKLYTKKVHFWIERNRPHRLVLQEDEGITEVSRTELVESSTARAEGLP